MAHVRIPKLVVAAAALVMLALTAGCSSKDSSSPAPVAGGPTFSFSFPAAGTPTVVGTQHIVTFTDAGSWGYYCIPHQGSGMTGTVVVSANSSNDSAYVQVGGGGGFSFVPNTVTIKVGGTVRFANVSAMTNHTVTRP